MVDIVSKRSGPRPEDERARKLIVANQPIIRKLADHLTDGAWSARQSRSATARPEPEGLVIHAARAVARAEEPRPFVRIAVNGRVSVVDLNTGVQMHHLGDVRRRDGRESFRLATRTNGFFSPVEPEIGVALADLDGAVLEGRDAETRLIAAINERLQL